MSATETNQELSIHELGQTMVQMVNQGRDQEAQFVADFYAADIVSIEGQDSEEMPGRMQGIDEIKAKHAWWYDNNTVHGTVVTGPFIGHRDDQFVLHLVMDVTPNGGERMQMSEVGIYTVKDGKIAQEEYLYQI